MSILTNILGGSILDGVGKIIGALKLSPDKRAEFEAAALASQTELAKLELELEAKAEEVFTRRVEAVNATMQAEAKSDSWLQKSWRPCIGFTVIAISINNFVLLPYFHNQGLLPVDIPQTVWGMFMAILGITAYTRGQEKVTKLQNGNGK